MKYFYILLMLIASNANAFELQGNKWGDPTFGTGATVSYSYLFGGEECDGGETCSALSSFMPVGFEAEIDRAFDAWSSVADLTFLDVTGQGTGDIQLGGHDFDGPSGVLAHAFFPPPNGTFAGDIHFDEDDTWVLGDNSINGFSIFVVAVHEIGHALGLEHEDSGVPSIMASFLGSITSLQPDDIAGIQAIYGAKPIATVPVPAALWLFASGLGLICLRKKSA